MRSLVLEKARHLAWHEVPEPTRQREREALVRPIAAATCDLDQPVIFGQTPFAPPTSSSPLARGVPSPCMRSTPLSRSVPPRSPTLAPTVSGSAKAASSVPGPSRDSRTGPWAPSR
jgi:hypothetical protein